MLVLLIYGGAIRKYFGTSVEPVQMEENPAVNSSAENLVKVSKKDHGKALILKPRDPFLDKVTVKRTLNVSASQKLSNSKNTSLSGGSPKHFIWPKIEYVGFLQSDQKSKKTGVLRINGKLFREPSGSKIEGMKIIRILSDSIQLQLSNGEKRYVKRST